MEGVSECVCASGQHSLRCVRVFVWVRLGTKQRFSCLLRCLLCECTGTCPHSCAPACLLASQCRSPAFTFS